MCVKDETNKQRASQHAVLSDREMNCVSYGRDE